MTSIEDWNDSQRNTYFLVEQDAPETTQDGDLKIHNPSRDPEQRRYWENTKGRYQKKIEIVVCTHGKDEDDQDFTLIVLCVQLTCTKGSRFKSVELCFNFEAQDSQAKTMPLEILGWAPFNTQERYKAGEETVRAKTYFDGNVGIEKGGPKIGLSGGGEKERSFQKEMYARAQSSSDYDEDSGTVTGVRWYLEEAKNQKDGVPPNFHLAMVVKPPVNKDSGAAQNFTGKLDIRVEAGLREEIHRFFCQREKDNHPVIFNPLRKPHLFSSGERVRDLLLNDSGELLPKGKFLGDTLLTIIDRINDVPSQARQDQE